MLAIPLNSKTHFNTYPGETTESLAPFKGGEEVSSYNI